MRQHKSIGGDLSRDGFDQFAVVTGPNGSGKSHLLEAIQEGAVHVAEQIGPDQTRLITSTELSDYQSMSDTGFELGSFSTRLFGIREHLLQQEWNHALGERSPNPQVIEHFANSVPLDIGAVRHMLSVAGKSLYEMTADDFRRYAPLQASPDPLGLDLLQRLNLYAARWLKNEFYRFLAERGEDVEVALSESDFRLVYGPPPWDAITKAMQTIGLPYRVPQPNLFDRFNEISKGNIAGSVPIEFLDTTTGRVVPPSDLSSGERALLRIALSLYGSTDEASAPAWPAVVLLDEPDAALHPSMVDRLMRLLRDTFVGELGLVVVMTTHSPTTVALAPEGSVFTMTRSDSPRLRARSNQEALGELLVGVPSLVVAVEDRRVVLVEHDNDVRIFEAATAALRGQLSGDRRLQFVAAGGTGTTNGRFPVVESVTNLRNAGNLAVWGIVDRDAGFDPVQHPAEVLPLDPDRYAVENVVADPLTVGLFLLFDQIVSPRTMGLPALSWRELDPAIYGHQIATWMTSQMFGQPTEAVSVVTYTGGSTLQIDTRWLEKRGHDLVEELRVNYPRLKQWNEVGMLTRFISTVWSDHPGFIPASLRSTFERILSA